jgi:hypothetical protein
MPLEERMPNLMNLEGIEVEIRTYPHFHSLNFVD